MMQRAVEIDGEAYWDGAYSANPPLRRLAIETEAEDILLVQIMPEEVDAVPHLSSEIGQRANVISFNASLQRELQALEDLRAGCHGATALFLPTARKLKRLRLHRIAATDWVSDLGARSMLDTSPTPCACSTRLGECSAAPTARCGGCFAASSPPSTRAGISLTRIVVVADRHE